MIVTDFTPFVPGILLALSAFLLSILSPGPNILAIMGTSMSEGRSSGVALAIGVASGSFLWALLTAFGLVTLLVKSAIALTLVKVVGGVFLLWLAWKSFKAAGSVHDLVVSSSTRDRAPWHRHYLKGLTVQMTNPKAALAWVAIISLGLTPDAPAIVAAIIIVGTTVLSITCHLLYALAFSTPTMVRLYGKARRWIQGTLGVFFTFAGLKLLLSRT